MAWEARRALAFGEWRFGGPRLQGYRGRSSSTNLKEMRGQLGKTGEGWWVTGNSTSKRKREGQKQSSRSGREFGLTLRRIS